MADSVFMVGGAAGLYRNTADYANPTWAEVALVRDVTPSGGFDFAEVSSRQTPLKTYAKTQIDKPIQVVMRADITSLEFQAWVEAANSRGATLDLLVLNAKRTVVGAVGWRGPWLVALTGEPQTLPDGIFVTFELRPTVVVEDEQQVTVTAAEVGAGAALQYTALAW